MLPEPDTERCLRSATATFTYSNTSAANTIDTGSNSKSGAVISASINSRRGILPANRVLEDRQVGSVDVDAYDPVSVCVIYVLEAIAGGTPNHRQGLRGVFFQHGRHQLAERLGLSDLGQRHVGFVIGRRYS